MFSKIGIFHQTSSLCLLVVVVRVLWAPTPFNKLPKGVPHLSITNGSHPWLHIVITCKALKKYWLPGPRSHKFRFHCLGVRPECLDFLKLGIFPKKKLFFKAFAINDGRKGLLLAGHLLGSESLFLYRDNMAAAGISGHADQNPQVPVPYRNALPPSCSLGPQPTLCHCGPDSVQVKHNVHPFICIGVVMNSVLLLATSSNVVIHCHSRVTTYV